MLDYDRLSIRPNSSQNDLLSTIKKSIRIKLPGGVLLALLELLRLIGLNALVECLQHVLVLLDYGLDLKLDFLLDLRSRTRKK